MYLASLCGTKEAALEFLKEHGGKYVTDKHGGSTLAGPGGGVLLARFKWGRVVRAHYNSEGKLFRTSVWSQRGGLLHYGKYLEPAVCVALRETKRDFAMVGKTKILFEAVLDHVGLDLTPVGLFRVCGDRLVALGRRGGPWAKQFISKKVHPSVLFDWLCENSPEFEGQAARRLRCFTNSQ